LIGQGKGDLRREGKNEGTGRKREDLGKRVMGKRTKGGEIGCSKQSGRN
jgi:hypothetical protein